MRLTGDKYLARAQSLLGHHQDLNPVLRWGKAVVSSPPVGMPTQKAETP